MDLQRLHLDKTLFYALLAMAAISLFVVYSASARDMDATLGHLLRLFLGFTVLLVVAQIRPEFLERWSPYIFIAGMLLLIAVLALGVIGKGAQRWLDLGFLRFQPAEVMKLAVLMLLAIVAIAAPFAWTHLHDYQRQRILTLFNPEADPLGTGYHTIQSMIAVGSGGVYGKGWLNSSHAHLQYL